MTPTTGSESGLGDGAAPVVVLATMPRTRRHADPVGSPLDGAAELRLVEWSDDMDAAARGALLDEALPGADALVAGPWIYAAMPPFTPERWALADRLQVIAGTFDNRFEGWLDVADALRRGVAVVDTSRSMTPSVAEYVLAMTLNALRDIPASIQIVREGDWPRGHWDQPGFVSGDLTGRRVGLAGFGVINRRFTELLGPFRCDVMAYDPFVADDVLEPAGVTRAGSLPELAARSDIFVVGIPPTPATQGIIDRATIDALPRGSILILPTRMAVMDQEALWRRAEAGEIRAAIDVFAPEPPPTDASFRTSPYVLPTPHIAGNTWQCHRRCFTTAGADALAVLAGRAPEFAVSPLDDRLYRGVIEGESAAD